MANKNKMSRREEFEINKINAMHKLIDEGITFALTDAIEEIAEEIDTSEDGKSLLITLDRSSEYVLVFNNVVLSGDMIRLSTDNNVTTVSIYSSSDDDMTPELELFMDKNEFLRVENYQNLYDIIVDKIPTHLMMHINNVQQMFPIIKYEDLGLQLLNGKLYYITDIKVWLNPTMLIPIIFTQVQTLASYSVDTHHSKLNYISSEINAIDTNKLTQDAFIVINDENSQNLYQVLDFSDHIMICADWNSAEKATVEIPYSALSDDNTSIIPSYEPIFTTDIADDVYTFNGTISNIDEKSKQMILDLMNFKSCYDGIDMNKIKDLYTSKQAGKRIDTKRNKNIVALKRSVKKFSELYMAYIHIIETFNLESILIYSNELKRIVHFNEDIILKDYYSFKNILRSLGVEADKMK